MFEKVLMRGWGRGGQAFWTEGVVEQKPRGWERGIGHQEYKWGRMRELGRALGTGPTMQGSFSTFL